MVISRVPNPRTLQLTLYTGVALVVISMLFLGRQQQGASFLAQAVTVLAVPAFFYAVGALVWRYLRTPLAAPGLIGTGAWLVGVGLIHLYDQRILLPEVIQPYYWFGASLLAGAVITLTGHRVRIWMLVPLVPLVQTNAAWAIMGALGVDVKWMPALTFLLIAAWWEAPFKDPRWITVYRASGVLLTLFVLLFNVWLPLSTPQSLMTTWGAAAALVALLGLRHGWARTGPLAIVILVCASMWGLPSVTWPLAWLALALVTVIFIERLAARESQSGDNKAVEISEALAVVLAGAAALYAQLTYTSGTMPPIVVLPALVGAGALMLWLGWRRHLLIAMHAGLWLTASAWALLYFIALPTSNMFGLWMALFAACALLVERLLSSIRQEKHKASRTVVETVVRWPVADLVMGLSAAIILWAAINITNAPPQVLAVTCSIVVTLWLAAGLFYRLPVLLHTALWIAPLPYALLLMIAAPWLWTLPRLGLAWQLLGVVFLLLGHSLPRYRPGVLAPFFIVGYALLGFGFTLAASDHNLLPISLGFVVLTSIGTSLAVIADLHPVWSVFIARVLPRHRVPYAYNHAQHLFLFLSTWLSAVWLHLMLGYTGIPLSRQGMFLVVFAALWFALGRLLSRFPGIVGWPVSSAGWFMWLVGLLEVFFSPTEAIITMILGLVISGEALRRSRGLYWIPIVIVQVFFTVLQITWMLQLPGWIVLMGITLAVSIGGMLHERRDLHIGRIIASTGATLAALVWFAHPDLSTLLGLNLLIIAATLTYRRWQLLWAVYIGTTLLVVQSQVFIDWRVLFLLGLSQFVIGAELVKEIRPRRYRTLSDMLFREMDWATPFLWAGILLTTAAWGLGLNSIFLSYDYLNLEISAFAFLAAGLLSVYTIRLHIRYLPDIALIAVLVGLFDINYRLHFLPYWSEDSVTVIFSTLLAAIALAVRWRCAQVLAEPRRLDHAHWCIWWIRPLISTTLVLISLSFLLLMFRGYFSQRPLLVLNSLFLTAYCGLAYTRRYNHRWLWAGVIIAAYTWILTVNTFHLSGHLWYSIPAGLGLLALARVLRYPHYVLVEGLGVIVLVIGAALNLSLNRILAPEAALLAVQIIALAAYGYTAGRRIPFTTALVVILAGSLWGVARLNLWLIPLGCGLLLLSVAILAEARGEALADWLQRWRSRWQTWA